MPISYQSPNPLRTESEASGYAEYLRLSLRHPVSDIGLSSILNI